MSDQRQIQLIEKKTLLERPLFRVDEAKFRQPLPDGNWSDEIVRLELDRGDSVAALIHNTARSTLVMVEQFRYPTYARGPGWILELPAGIVDRGSGETPEQAMRRELFEETGYRLEHLQPIHTFYPSPGGSSEKIYLFYAQAAEGSRVSQGGGLAASGEFIRVLDLPVEEAFRKAERLEILDAKTIIGLQWLKLHSAA